MTASTKPVTEMQAADRPGAAKAPVLGDPQALLEPSRVIGEMCAEFGAELLRLASRRLAAQAELMDQLAHSANLAEAMDRQMNFWQRASSDYAQSLNGAFSRSQALIAGNGGRAVVETATVAPAVRTAAD